MNTGVHLFYKPVSNKDLVLSATEVNKSRISEITTHGMLDTISGPALYADHYMTSVQFNNNTLAGLKEKKFPPKDIWQSKLANVLCETGLL